MPIKDDEAARKAKAESIRKTIDRLRKGEPSPSPLSPRELTDRGARTAEKSEEDGRRSPENKKKPAAGVSRPPE